jgi:spoIIIJ-associated protein
MKEIETEGKNVTIAVENGLKQLGLRRDQVEVQVVEEGSPGFLGIGSKPARVLLREKRWGTESAPEEPPALRPSAARPPQGRAPQDHSPHSAGGPRHHPPRHHRHERSHPAPAERRPPGAPAQAESQPGAGAAPPAPADTAKACETALGVLREMFSLMGIGGALVQTRWDSEQERVRAEVESSDAGVIIGKGGKTLESLQFLVTVITGRRLGSPVAVQVDTQGYWKRIEDRIVSDIEKAVSEVRKTGHPWHFDPMDPAMRRLVHRKLMNHPEVETSSEGEGPWRKVVIRPRRKGN